jgi:uncharacterized protein YcfJ
MRAVLKSVSLVTFALTSTGAFAWNDSAPEYDMARVVSVDPIIEYFDEPVSRDVCWNEPVERYEPNHRYVRPSRDDRAGATLLGAIIGGALGNQIGKGDGRKAATIAGAMIGGAIAQEESQRGRYRDVGGRYVQDYEQRCDTRTEYRQQERVVGYDVAYDYNGRVYRTRTDHHPGDTIRVAVQVSAVP